MKHIEAEELGFSETPVWEGDEENYASFREALGVYGGDIVIHRNGRWGVAVFAAPNGEKGTLYTAQIFWDNDGGYMWTVDAQPLLEGWS